MHANGLRDDTPGSGDLGDAVAAKGSFLKRLSEALSRSAGNGPLHYLTTLHPCFINGARTLVHKRGLDREQPTIFQRLRAYALSSGFVLLEDRRKRELACRDERRRLAPVLMFAAGLVSNAIMAEDGTLRDGGAAVVPTIEVLGQRESEDRAYLIEAGKRFVSKPHGSIELMLGIASEVRAHGDKHRVRTRGLQMSAQYTDAFIDRYDYRMPEDCGGSAFSVYEGEGFAALGYRAERGVVILDVLAGGGPFSAPQLWGAYDQVLHSNIRMDLMFGDGARDAMGVLKASYKIGLRPVMRTGTKNYYGELYSRALAAAATCVAPALPDVHQAGTVAPKVGDAS